MRYDQKNDRIDFLVVYRGVFYESGSGKTEDPMKNAFTDLEEVLDRGQSFFWNNWPLQIDPVKPGTPGAALAAHLEVENGGLYTEPTGRLNGYQFVRIVRAEAFLQKLNTMLELGAQAAMLGGFRGVKFDRDTKEIVTEFLRSGEKMITIERGRLQLRLPCTKGDFEQLLGKLEDHLVDNVPGEIFRRIAAEKKRATETEVQPAEILIGRTDLEAGLRQSAGMRFFWNNEITIERSAELQTIGIGARGNEQLIVQKGSDGLYTDNFLLALRERGDKFEEGVPDQEIHRRFADFLTREPVMPEALRALREKK